MKHQTQLIAIIKEIEEIKKYPFTAFRKIKDGKFQAMRRSLGILIFKISKIWNEGPNKAIF